MFVRQKRNANGMISVQVIDKSSGKYKVLKTIGSSSDSHQVERLCQSALQWIKHHTGLLELDFTNYRLHTQQVLQGIEEHTLQGPWLLLGKIFDEIGFGSIEDELFRQLVIARICYPVSKLKTTDYLSKYQFINVDVQVVYRYLDKLHKVQKELVQQISYQHTLKVLGGSISVVFYDVTTIYFESDNEDELRKTGFSKDGKHQHPQIVLGLLVSEGGYPLAYDIFEGNQFEGHTMLPVINALKAKYNIENLVVIADAGLLSNDNIMLLQQQGYEYILGARIKAEAKTIKAKILSLKMQAGICREIKKHDNTRLLITYSAQRARKDAHNRERGLKKLEKLIKTGKLNKASINNRGYNKFLNIENEVSISLNSSKVAEDKKWDGLKGYLTNSRLPTEAILENYKNLWQIEKALRIAKTDLKIRPIYHRVQRRIEAHICIAFVAYKVYKELERQLKVKQSGLSPEKAIDIAKTIFALKVVHPVSKETFHKLLLLTNEQRLLADLFQF